MRIVSLLPSATELVYALGIDDLLVGRTDECDWPPATTTKPIVSRQAIPYDSGLTSEEIDRRVSELVAAGQPLYTLDAEAIRDLRPDLILAQDLCRVCAVPSGDVEGALDTIGCRADVISLDPATMDDVLACLLTIGRATGFDDRAVAAVAALRGRLDAVADAVAGRARPRVLTLEWREPPFTGGHWVPDMVVAAGGTPVLSNPGEKSQRVTWDAVATADPEVVVFMPCGYDLARATTEAAGLLDEPALRRSPAVGDGRVWVADATSYFSRPSPRIVDGVELLAWALHPDAVTPPPPGRLARLDPEQAGRRA